MKAKFIICVIAVGFILNIKATNMSKKTTFFTYLQQDSGILISQRSFDKLIDEYVPILQKKGLIGSIGDYITLARMFNTIAYSNLYNLPKYRKFVDSFAGEYFNLTINRLEALPRKGLYYYSKKYDLSIGGPFNKNSVFKIIR